MKVSGVQCCLTPNSVLLCSAEEKNHTGLDKGEKIITEMLFLDELSL